MARDSFSTQSNRIVTVDTNGSIVESTIVYNCDAQILNTDGAIGEHVKLGFLFYFEFNWHQ